MFQVGFFHSEVLVCGATERSVSDFGWRESNSDGLFLVNFHEQLVESTERATFTIKMHLEKLKRKRNHTKTWIWEAINLFRMGATLMNAGAMSVEKIASFKNVEDIFMNHESRASVGLLCSEFNFEFISSQTVLHAEEIPITLKAE